ncbi:MAG: hypothetical protein QOD07_1549 [Frankiaceae bacterium]|jgi:hypothetical protein|nr:hypothetical protein [Frankiaceae bacterium]
MCTYVTETLPVTGSAKGPDGWIRVTDATVYFDHPAHALAEHTLNIDVRRPEAGPAARVAVELTADSARELAHAILRILDDPSVVSLG